MGYEDVSDEGTGILASDEEMVLYGEPERRRAEARCAAHRDLIEAGDFEAVSTLAPAIYEARRTIKRVEEHLLGRMEDGTYVAPWATFTAQEIREKLWEMYDALIDDRVQDYTNESKA